MGNHSDHYDGREAPSKGARLGKFTPQPMISTVLDLYGLKVKDAIEIVERKINRALLADAKEIKVLHGKTPEKLKKALHQYLSTIDAVKSYETPENNPNVTFIRL